MLISKDTKEFKWIWVDGKLHKVSVEFEGDLLDIAELNDAANKIVEDKEELCKSIYFLGLCITGNPESAWGFLMGWLIRSIKKDKLWQVNHSEEDVPVEERNDHIADTFENIAKMIREGKFNKTISTPNIGGDDGTDFFKK